MQRSGGEDSVLDFKTAQRNASGVNDPLACWKRRVDTTCPFMGESLFGADEFIIYPPKPFASQMLLMCYVFAVQPKEPWKTEFNK